MVVHPQESLEPTSTRRVVAPVLEVGSPVKTHISRYEAMSGHDSPARMSVISQTSSFGGDTSRLTPDEIKRIMFQHGASKNLFSPVGDGPASKVPTVSLEAKIEKIIGDKMSLVTDAIADISLKCAKLEAAQNVLDEQLQVKIHSAEDNHARSCELSEMLRQATSKSDAQLAELRATLLLQMESVVQKWEERFGTQDRNIEERMARHVQSTVQNEDRILKLQAQLHNSGTNLEAQEGQYLKRGEVNEQIVELHMKLEDCEKIIGDKMSLVTDAIADVSLKNAKLEAAQKVLDEQLLAKVNSAEDHHARGRELSEMLSQATSKSDAQLAELRATLLLQMESVVQKWEERFGTQDRNIEERMARHIQSTVQNEDRIIQLQAQLHNSGTNLEAQQQSAAEDPHAHSRELSEIVSQATSKSDVQLAELRATLLSQMESVVEERMARHVQSTVQNEDHTLKLQAQLHNSADLRQLVEMIQKAKDSPVVEEGMKTEKYVGNAALVRALSISQQNECFPDGCIAS